MSKFETGISENYLTNWGMVQTLKEFVQNAVYAKQILGDEIVINHDGEFAHICNSPSGFTKGKLLVGESEQRGVIGAPGCYGEGAKMAMMVACRLNADCFISTNGFDVKPMLEPSSLDPEVRALVFEVTDTDVNTGTIITVQCTKEELDEAVKSFAVLCGVPKEVIIKDTILYDKPGEIFINGVKVASTSAVFGYNFTDTDLMNRDRSSINMDTIGKHVSGLLSDIKVEHAKVLLEKVVADSNLLEAKYPPTFWKASRSMWKETIKATYGTEKVAIASGGESDTAARYHHFKIISNVPTQWIGFLGDRADIYKTDSLEQVAKVFKPVHRKPTGEDTNNLAWCKQMIKRFYADYGTVKVTDELIDAYGNPCDGLHVYDEDTTWIRRDVLSSKENTFKTLLHETVHRISRCSDNTTGYTREMERAAWCIINKGRVM